MQKGNSGKHIQINGNQLIHPSQILITSIFCEKVADYQQAKKILVLTQRCIFVYENPGESTQIQQAMNSHQLSTIQFDERFEILKENPSINGQKNKLKGIRFEKQFKTSRIFSSSDPSTIQKWKFFLQNKMNQINFKSCIQPIKRILSGDSFTLYEAIRVDDNKNVIVKAYTKENAYSKQNQKKKLLNEILILRKLHQENIYTLLQIFQSEISIYLILQSKGGACLYKIINSKQIISSTKIKKIVSRVLEKVINLHQKGFVHSNLISKNIFITDQENNLDIQIFNYQNALQYQMDHLNPENYFCNFDLGQRKFTEDFLKERNRDFVGLALILKQLLEKQRSQVSVWNIDNMIGFQLIHQIINNPLQRSFIISDYRQHRYFKQHLHKGREEMIYNSDLKPVKKCQINTNKILQPSSIGFHEKYLQINEQVNKIEEIFGTGQKLLVRRKSKFEKKLSPDSLISQNMIN